jgi:beta-glucosidase-like glycosyl hydrolase
MAAVDVAATRVTTLLLASRRAVERRDEQLAGAPSWARSHAAILAHNHELARQIALESAVLLKNERGTLPLPPPGTARHGRQNRLAVIGSFATNPRY